MSLVPALRVSLLLAALTLGATCAAGEAAPAPDGPAWPPQAPWPAWADPASKTPGLEAVDDRQAAAWLRWVIPLPKRVRLPARLRVPTKALALRLRADASDLERGAASAFLDALDAKTAAPGGEGDFPILVSPCDRQGRLDGRAIPGAELLAGLKNSDQAYLIAPLADRGLAVTALTPEGLWYGLKTLAQLMRPLRSAPEATVPLAAVLDWPDLAERGEWGGSATRDIALFADLKLNLIEAHCQLGLDPAGRGTAALDARAQAAAHAHAIRWVPIITHLDQLGGTGLYKRFPELRGKGAAAQARGTDGVCAPCFSQPKMGEVLADWFTALAATPGVRDICVWLSEHHVHCECDPCKATGQYALEAAACVRAWQTARQARPEVRLRILLTQGSYSTNDQVLAAASDPQVGITYYDGGRTYDSSRDPMIYPLLEDFARRGRWLGCYPQLTASWRIVCPWSGPQFIRTRMAEFVEKRLQCLCGYATPDNRFYDFNVAAAAEWSWNARGRTEREFAAAWATRRGLPKPDTVAEWAVLLGPVGWDVYGSGIPYPHLFGRAAQTLRDRKPPRLGQGLFRYFPSVEHIRRDLEVCEQALALARETNAPAILTETQVIRGYVGMVHQLHALAELVAGKDRLNEEELKRAQQAFDALAGHATDVVSALAAWQAAVAPDCKAPRVQDTVNVTRDTLAAVAQALRPLGVTDRRPPLRPGK